MKSRWLSKDDMMQTQERVRFDLRLAGNQHWQIVGEGEQCGLVERLAHVMRLKPANGQNGAMQLIFTDVMTEHGGHLTVNMSPVFSTPSLRIWWQQDHNLDIVRSEVLKVPEDNEQYAIMRLGTQIIQHVNAMRGGLPVHAASAELNGDAVLLVARSRTGKSTCCQRFPEYWKVLEDDQALVVKENLDYVVHPMPTWSHYQTGEGYVTWKTGAATPVKAIFFLEQSECDEVIPISQSEGGWRLYIGVHPTYREICFYSNTGTLRQLNTMLFHNACDCGLHIPSFILRVSLQGHFWENIENVLQQLRFHKDSA